MSKKGKITTKVLNGLLFGISSDAFSKAANTRNFRAVQTLLDDLSIEYNKLIYFDGKNYINTFQTDYKHKDYIKKIVKKHNQSFVLACMGTKKGTYGVFKEDVDKVDKEKEGLGWIEGLKEEEAKKHPQWFYDKDRSAYFIIKSQENIIIKVA